MTGEMLPRGIRNNNPGNLRPGQPWLGVVGVDTAGGLPGYLIFDKPTHGLRAIVRVLIAYQVRDRLKTPRAMIERWAPPSDDNPTAAYAANVAAALGVGPDDEISLYEQNVKPFLDAILIQENGRPDAYGRAAWFDEATIEGAIAMAFGAAG